MLPAQSWHNVAPYLCAVWKATGASRSYHPRALFHLKRREKHLEQTEQTFGELLGI